jgi:hypothetical protein
MTMFIRSFQPLQDCCCMGAPRVLPRSAPSMAFNFSAAPEKAYQPESLSQARSHSNAPRNTRDFFGRMDFFPAY